MSLRARTTHSDLRRLAHLYGIQTAYYDVAHRRVVASPDALVAALRAWGAPVETEADVHGAMCAKSLSDWRWHLEAVTVAWDGLPAATPLRLPRSDARGRMRLQLRLEDGETKQWTTDLESLPTVAGAEIDGVSYVEKAIDLPALPFGYHSLTVEAAKDHRLEMMVISAPTRVYQPPTSRRWGVFLPLYALQSAQSWGSGDLGALAGLQEWLGRSGGDLVATLPLLASFLDRPFVPSPYSPVSRLFWNEMYLDVPAALDRLDCKAASHIAASLPIRNEISALRSEALIDYKREMRLKRKVMEKASECFFAAPARPDGFRRFLESGLHVEDYARFRATTEKRAEPWRRWPDRLRYGELRAGDYDEPVKDYHLVVQWLFEEQMDSVSRPAREKGQDIYLDLPVGVHPDGYDAWRFRDVFVDGVDCGAPPDTVFTTGQDWGFAPPHPERIRESRYAYAIAYLRQHLRHATLLRIDHVMGLHRLYWIPKGGGEGVYVRYHPDEMYAVLSVESHRHRSSVVGENLGTVPPYVNPALDKHGIGRMYVLHYELHPDREKPLGAVPRSAVASLNTHDMPPFVSFWSGADIDERVRLSVLDPGQAEKERLQRRRQREALLALLRARDLLPPACEDVSSVMRACLALLASGRARLVLVNLEDPWGETQPQNVPGTLDQYPNWRRKARYSLEDMERLAEVVEALADVAERREAVGGRR